MFSQEIIIIICSGSSNSRSRMSEIMSILFPLFHDWALLMASDTFKFVLVVIEQT